LRKDTTVATTSTRLPTYPTARHPARVGPIIRRQLPALLIHGLLIAGSLLTVLPMLWMFLSAFKPSHEIIQVPPTLFPREPTLENFRNIFTTLPFLRFLINSLIVTLVGTLLLVFFTSLAGFVFAKFDFFGKNVIYAVMLLTMMIADEVLVLPVYLMIAKLHWNNTYQALIVPFLFTGFAVFLMRQFISTVPTELIEAAIIDGASYLRIYWSIVLPLIGPALASLGIFNFVWMWNMFMWPTVAVDTERMMTLQVALSRFTSMYLTRYDLTMAAASVATVPILIVYLVLQRSFVKGIALSGLKQ
jgi:multiple sugar transport system permease protein